MPLTLENELAHRIIGFAIEIHKSIGPGLNTNVYKKCLAYEFKNADLNSQESYPIVLNYKTLEINDGICIDILVAEKVVVMIESSENITEYQVQKLLRILRLGNFKLGLLVNFNTTLLKDGIRRVSNNKLIEKELELDSFNGIEDQVQI